MCRNGAILNVKMRSNQIVGGALRRSDDARLRTGIGCHAQDHLRHRCRCDRSSCFVAFLSLSSQVIASSPGAKSDRVDMRPLGTDCSQKASPYFEGACLRDTKNPLAQPRDMRIITAEQTR